MPEQNESEESAWARTRGAFWRVNRTQVVVGFLLALLGFAAVTQVRENDQDTAFAGYREQDLIDVLNGLAGTTQRAQSEIVRLEQSRDDLLDSTSKRQAALEEARSEVTTLSILAGTVPVTGPGIRVRIVEDTAAVNMDTFLDLIEELRSVGAEAIQVNGTHRLVAESYIDQVPGGLVVDGAVLSPPYTVEAIGEPTTLAGAVKFARGPGDQLEADGASVTVNKLQTLDITAVRDPDGSAPEGQ